MISAIRKRLADAADPARAEPMRAYMKSALPYRGVRVPEVRRICHDLCCEIDIDQRADWEATVRQLFDDAEFREERYAAIGLTGHRSYSHWQDPDTVPLYEHLITTGAWWDLVDEIAIRRIGPLLRAYPAVIEPQLLAWAGGPDMWLRRTAIISQVGSKEATDRRLLTACIEPNIDDAEFFLRKAIGWALRAYAKIEPSWVRTYVAANADRLSNLSRREALKNIVAEDSAISASGDRRTPPKTIG